MEYDKAFYDFSEESTKRAAKLILPYVIEWIHPKSIVDFGCGEGIWLSVVEKINSSIDICGMDGAYVSMDELKIDQEKFIPTDLTGKVELGRKYDLAISLEVGEHLREEYTDVFVDNIVRHADRVLFSAAIPNQGGVHHVNERWQSYWINKFAERGYFVSYLLRNHFWENEMITPWRRQNILFFSKYKEDFEGKEEDERISDVVHPEMYLMRCKQTFIDIKKIYNSIDRVIESLIEKGIQEIVICPYGNHGFLCKEILNNKYHINEIAVLDNRLCLTDHNIYPIDYLKNLRGNFYIIENSGNEDIRREILEELREYVPDKQILSVFHSDH